MALQPKHPKRQRPALRLVSTKDMTREEWLLHRNRGIGASEAAAAVGVSPYQSQLELWMIKTGRADAMPKPDPDDDSTPIFWGNVLEPVVAECYTRRTGNKVRRVNAVLQHPDKDKAWMLANLDYAVVGNPSVHVLECKTAGEWGAKLWRDGVPEYIQCQVQHQLAVTGKPAADVAVLLCGQDLQVFRIERDDELIDRLIELERRFWHYVETDTPPPADGSDSAATALQYLYPHDAGTTLDFAEEASLNHTFDELVAVRDEVKVLAQYEDKLKQTLQQAMGDASRAVFRQGSISWKRSKDSTVLDTETLLADQPALITQYPKHRAGSRRFLVRPSTS